MSSSSALTLSANLTSRSMMSPSSVGIRLTLTDDMAAVSSRVASSLIVASNASTTSGGLRNAMQANSRTTRSALTPVRRLRSARALSIYARTLTFAISLAACWSALRGAYPARIAACLPFRSIRYSFTKTCCFTVSSTITSHSSLLFTPTYHLNRAKTSKHMSKHTKKTARKKQPFSYSGFSCS
ncbi:hypothetical protein SDC9_196529 [bioreactor metagenome]|uniref:Uncharacterized protein n=1 Tax=bioreactor metagenome TaxID=1076179 RepID=A0A645IDC5_9ZZZZ